MTPDPKAPKGCPLAPIHSPADWERRPQPAVTAVLMTYCQEDYAAEALRSLLAQDYPKLEIIVTDDASPDRTFPILKALLQGYRGPHRVLLGQNAGNLRIGGQWRLVSAVASGAWLTLFAGDDTSDPDRISAMMAALAPHPDALVASARNRELLPSGAVLPPEDAPSAPIRHAFRRGDDLTRYFCGTCNGASAMWSRALFDFLRAQPKGIDSHIEIDDDFLTWVALLLAYSRGRGVILQTPLCKVTHRLGTGITHRGSLRPGMTFRQCLALYDAWARYWLRQRNLWERLGEIFAPLFAEDREARAIRALKTCFATLSAGQGGLRDLLRAWGALNARGKRLCLRAWLLHRVLGRGGLSAARWLYANLAPRGAGRLGGGQ